MGRTRRKKVSLGIWVSEEPDQSVYPQGLHSPLKLESKRPDYTLRMCKMIWICMFEGTFSFDAAQMKLHMKGYNHEA